MQTTSLSSAALLLASIALLPAPAVGAPAQGTLDIVETAQSTGRFDTLLAAVDAAGLTATLKGPGTFTVFAPTDTAFAALPADRLAYFLDPANASALSALLLYHVAPGAVPASQVLADGFVDTVQGQRIEITASPAGAFADSARLIRTDIAASNGIIHVIDSLLVPNFLDIPSTAGNAGVFQTLLAAVGAADLTGILQGPGRFTVLAPTDAAFAKLPAGTVANLLLPQNKALLIDILSYHVIGSKAYSEQALAAGSVTTLQGDTVTFTAAGTTLFVEGVMILQADLDASNGVIHVIDEVLMP